MADARTRYGAADVRYVAAYQPDTAPPRLQMTLAIADTVWRPADRERITVLDIGCGRGVTACLLAAANPHWDVIGLDLQPVHIAEAREIAAEAGLDNARFIEADLAELDEESSARLLPEVDVVICYGVWTWVPDAVREGIVRLLRSRVKAGGLVFMGYNALPGFADCIPLQRLLEEAVRGMPGTDTERGAAALAAIEALRAAGARHLPREEVLDYILSRGRSAPAYMVHEWLTSFWRPLFHADLARDLERARLDYGGCARPARSLPDLNLTETRLHAVAAAPPGLARETVLDVFLTRRFRTDIFVRGRRPGGREMLPGIRMALDVAPEAAKIHIPTEVGEASLPPHQAEALLTALAAGPRSLGELAALPALEGLTPLDLAVLLLEGDVASPLWRDVDVGAEARARAARCNATLLRRLAPEAAAASAPLGAVVPALGTAIPASPSELAAIVALQAGVPAETAALIEALVSPRDGPEARSRMAEGIARLLEKRLPAWRRIGLV
ncbi:methyltransferase domain-containing protein [Roseomonas eburnea]|uniref:Methyltransferase domain-containing protein n=1 Tax=Neoroseomonas eburnea TaxID=1346889 RepID=A0A9X9XK23_9PROT|nr:class I SAM-dependent methyltransferase [Neoroseomonas eburnea]MBR0684059.1 methyltransferase domain-containing protein [Neoroseomonas eburnea]